MAILPGVKKLFGSGLAVHLEPTAGTLANGNEIMHQPTDYQHPVHVELKRSNYEVLLTSACDATGA